MAAQDPSIVEVITRAIHDAQELVRGEIALAKAEARQELSRLSGGAVLFAGAAFSGLMGLVFLLGALAWALADGFDWPVWAGLGVVALIMLVLAALLAVAGRARMRSDKRMPLTVETLKENMEWMRARTS